MTTFADWLPAALVGSTFTAIGLLKVYGLFRGIQGGGGKSLRERLCGSCPSWSRGLNAGISLLLLAIGIGNFVWLAWILSVGTRDKPPIGTAQLSQREAELIETILRRQGAVHPLDRIYFLTVTPRSEWGENGEWLALPSEFHAQVSDLRPQYRPASEAYIHDDRVLQRRTNAEGWMQWVTVRRWISDTEAEVEDGVWCCPLGGGASTSVYELQGGKRDVKKRLGGWES